MWFKIDLFSKIQRLKDQLQFYITPLASEMQYY